jgi:hypothetical protein
MGKLAQRVIHVDSTSTHGTCRIVRHFLALPDPPRERQTSRAARGDTHTLRPDRRFVNRGIHGGCAFHWVGKLFRPQNAMFWRRVDTQPDAASFNAQYDKLNCVANGDAFTGLAA